MRRKNKTTVPSVEEFKRALLGIEASLPKAHREMLLVNYHAANRTITTAQLAKAVGYKSYDGVIRQYAKFGDHLCDFLEYEPTTTMGKADCVWASVLTDSPPARSIDEWEWTLRPEIVQALEELGWVDERETSDDEFGNADDYFKAFQALEENGKGIHERHLALLKAHFDAPNHTATWRSLPKPLAIPVAIPSICSTARSRVVWHSNLEFERSRRAFGSMSSRVGQIKENVGIKRSCFAAL